jgi:hypothetical protein
MIKAVVTNGTIVPRAPLPEDWQEGTEVTVEKCTEGAMADKDVDRSEAWINEVEAIARQGDPADERRLEAAVGEVRCREKEMAGKRPGFARSLSQFLQSLANFAATVASR